ncbi:MAG: glycosyltransferase 87 family protein [Actinomycetota bacterium]
MKRRTLIILVCAFLASRVLNVSLAYLPINYNAGFGDLQKYQSWSTAIVEDKLDLYSNASIEYPPGVLPFLGAAKIVPFGGSEFGQQFIWIMVFLDLAGFVGVLLLARRWGSSLGPWVWIVAMLLLGPIVYLRLDLIPAVATVWAIQRASVGRWGGAGGWLGFGAIAKVYPAFLLLPAFEVTPRFKRLLGGAALIAALFLLPIVVSGSWHGLLDGVIGFHSQRGVHVESTWGFLLLTASEFGYDMHPNFQFGANEAVSGVSDLLKSIGLAGSFAALGLGWWMVGRYVGRGDVPFLAAGMFGTLALLMFLGTVFSPQFGVWLIGLGAAALSHPLTRRLRWSLLSVLPIALLTQIIFPFTIGDVLGPFYAGASEPGSPLGLTVLGLRNFLVLAAGVATFWGLKAASQSRKEAGRLPEKVPV